MERIFRLGEFFQDANGQFSSMRLYSFIALFTAIFYTLYPMVMRGERFYFETLTIWIVGAFCPKLIQKFAENKLPKKEG